MSPSLDSPARQTRSVDSVKVAEKDMRISFCAYLALWVSPFPHPQFVSPSFVRFLFRVVHSLHCMQRSCCPVWALQHIGLLVWWKVCV